MIKNEKITEINKSRKNLRDILMPEVTSFYGTQIEILNNNEVVVEGCKGILEYDNNSIRLNLGKMSVKFTGDNLIITCMNSDNIVIKGFITSVEFMT